ncbi:YopX family protein [Porcipelethomonas ammoniilytica]|uniref:YopX family protein n=1 Tax=Porcipelethomonas ammoniilytica TaxID=2981722 RepID=UPI0008221407|nr:YopX family protein [Porcipelethomonas ammoniilytica]MCU6720628.1 YopX family protein [Porcipelethomonas ammoniilytica]SCJ19399.1 YopX protein [uncultured Ruminococcus sp.]
MNREILFRGKRVDNGEWVNGYLVKKIDPLYTDIETHCILHQERDNCGCLMPLMTWTRVDVETIGQYTGLTDKNGVKIFEGDIIKHKENLFEIKYSTEQARYLAVLTNGVFDPVAMQNCEVVGNVFDNSELLKGEENE